MTNTTLARLLAVSTLAILPTVLIPATAAADAAQVSQPAAVDASADSLAEQARRASTAAEHAAVSQRFRLRAEALSQELTSLDSEIRNSTKGPHSAMRYKWPAMDPSPTARLRARSMDLRRAVAEAQRASAHHAQRAVEEGFKTGTAAQR